MKLRWTCGSVRFRISPKELDLLVKGLPVEEELSLPGGSWRAVIDPTETTDIKISGGELVLHISQQDLARLAMPVAEGVYFIDRGEQALRYYVEKDFPCAHPGAPEAAEPESETFAPPLGFKERHRS